MDDGFPWPLMVSPEVTGGGWMFIEDYCNSGPKGNQITVSTRMMNAQDELAVIELGPKVVDIVLEKETTGWDPLVDLAYSRDHPDEEYDE